MIDELAIADLGVIAASRLPLGPGFTAITGETGAGKTMIVTALGLIMGERGDASRVRHGSERARVACVITDPSGAVRELVEDLGGDVDDHELVLTRTVSSEGRSRAVIGGARAPIAALAELSTHLFCVHGQSDQLRLRSATAQRETLDRFGGSELRVALTEYRDAHRLRSERETEYRTLTEQRDERRATAERLAADVAAITAVDPQPGEDTQLRHTIERLSNAEALREAVARGQQALAAESDDPYHADGVTLVGAAAQALSTARELDPTLGEVHDRIVGALVALEDASRDVARYLSDLESDGPARLQEAHERKSAIDDLLRQFGPEIQDVQTYVNEASARLLTLEHDDARLVELDAELVQARERETHAADALSAARERAAESLGAQVTAELQALALPEAQLQVTVTRGERTASGQDTVQFMLVSHAGGQPHPLAKSASGGELSRVMLALEVVLAGTDPVPTFVFDEVDAGVGGAAAIEIGRRLQQLSRSAQVIVVTHLAQVAAFADNHLRIVKDSSGGFTESSCTALSGGEREAEMARLLSGLESSQSGREHARELLDLGARSAETIRDTSV